MSSRQRASHLAAFPTHGSSRISGASPAAASASAGTAWVPPTVEHLQDLLPGYEVLALIGRGGMGAVYKARQISLQRLVAIKILPVDVTDDEVNYAERFKNEARTMARLSHPGIVSLFEFGETAEHQLYMVLEFIEGTDVAQLLQERPSLPAEEALRIAAHMCDALGYAHSHRVVHRDIKPANVMLDKDGRVKVADFGLAKMTGGELIGLTQTNMVLGTPDFIAPETYLGMHFADHRADIFAVGVMLYRMITGSIPRGSFLKPSHKVRGLDPRIDHLIGRAMEEDREHRYQSAGELRAAIDAVLDRPVTSLQAPSQAGRIVPQASGRALQAPFSLPQHAHAGGQERGHEREHAHVKHALPLGTIFLVFMAAAAVLFLWVIKQRRATQSSAAPAVASASAPGSNSDAAPVASPAKATSPAFPAPSVSPSAVSSSSPTAPPAAAPVMPPVAAPVAPDTAPPASVSGGYRITGPPGAIIIEGESAAPHSTSAGVVEAVTMGSDQEKWSGGAGLRWSGFQVGSQMTVSFTVPTAGTYFVRACLLRGPGQVDVTATLDRMPASYGVVQLDASSARRTPGLFWGAHILEAGQHTLEITAARTGSGFKGPSHGFALDYLMIYPAAGSATTYPETLAVASDRAAVPPREQAWTDNQGRTISATFRGLAGGKVQLELPSRRVSEVPLEKLSPESQRAAAGLAAASSSTSPGTPQLSEIIVEGQFEVSDLVLSSGGLRILHRNFAKPAQLVVNGKPWTPVWTGNGNMSSMCDVLDTPLKPLREDRFVEVTRLAGRGMVHVEAFPQRQNNETIMVRITDEPNGAGAYKVRLRW